MFDLKKMQQMQQQLQEQMANVQNEMAEKVVEGSSGGGVVTAEVNGNQELVSISIKPEAVDPDDIEMLEDLVMAAVNQAVEKSKDLQQDAMGKITGGMLPPGFNLPM
ncbi:MAG: YbaB/EbfC family nucleoid-associated protein [Candidatus Sumerlaeia bacterium]